MSNLAEKILAAIKCRQAEIEQRALANSRTSGYGTFVSRQSVEEANERHTAYRLCAADLEIVEYYQTTIVRYKQLKSHDLLSSEQHGELRLVEARIADFVAIILPALARGYGVQPIPGDDRLSAGPRPGEAP